MWNTNEANSIMSALSKSMATGCGLEAAGLHWNPDRLNEWISCTYRKRNICTDA